MIPYTFLATILGAGDIAYEDARIAKLSRPAMPGEIPGDGECIVYARGMRVGETVYLAHCQIESEGFLIKRAGQP